MLLLGLINYNKREIFIGLKKEIGKKKDKLLCPSLLSAVKNV